jgi:hypothetical protein
MSKIDLSEFTERLGSSECPETVREIVSFLREAAGRCGVVDWRAHSTPGSGWGLTGFKGGRVFCRIDPKPSIPHVCVSIPGAGSRFKSRGSTPPAKECCRLG